MKNSITIALLATINPVWANKVETNIPTHGLFYTVDATQLSHNSLEMNKINLDNPPTQTADNN